MGSISASIRILAAIAIIAISGHSGQTESPTWVDRGGDGATSISDACPLRLRAGTPVQFVLVQQHRVDVDRSNCTQPCSSECAHSAGFGCCTPGLLANHLPDLVAIAIAGARFDRADSAIAGTDPEAPQEPPQTFA